MAGELDKYDMVLFPGGSGSRQAIGLGEEARTVVYNYVVNTGGGYLGVCAGMYLSFAHFDWGIPLVDAAEKSPEWHRGSGDVMVELTELGRNIFGNIVEPIELNFSNGPVFREFNSSLYPDYEVLAYYRSEIANFNSVKGNMLDSAAIIYTIHGAGKILCMSPHPEKTEQYSYFVRNAIIWICDKEN